MVCGICWYYDFAEYIIKKYVKEKQNSESPNLRQGYRGICDFL